MNHVLLFGCRRSPKASEAPPKETMARVSVGHHRAGVEMQRRGWLSKSGRKKG